MSEIKALANLIWSNTGCSEKSADQAAVAVSDYFSDACASVQRERDALREMLGEAVQVIRDWRDWLNCEEPERVPDAADHEAMIILAMGAFLSRYEGEVKL